jgi:hypothetical protein
MTIDDFPFVVRRRTLDGREQAACVARRAIARGERICTMTGEIHPLAETLARIARGDDRSGDDPVAIGHDLYLHVGEPFLYFNHACEPNAALAGVCDVVALRAIAPGEEITLDYSLNNPVANRYVMKFVCECGSPLCRRTIGSVATVPVERLRFYLEAGGVQEFLRDEVATLIRGERLG